MCPRNDLTADAIEGVRVVVPAYKGYFVDCFIVPIDNDYNDNKELLKIKVTNRNSREEYQYSFNCGWMPEGNKQWMATVFSHSIIDAIVDARKRLKAKMHKYYDAFVASFTNGD